MKRPNPTLAFLMVLVGVSLLLITLQCIHQARPQQPLTPTPISSILDSESSATETVTATPTDVPTLTATPTAREIGPVLPTKTATPTFTPMPTGTPSRPSELPRAGG